MKDKKITSGMLRLLAKQSLKSGRIRNIFVMITIVLASALLTGILMFGVGQSENMKKEASRMQQVIYFELNDEQVEKLCEDERISYTLLMKSGIMTEMDGFSVNPYYVSEFADQIYIGELESGKLPQEKNEIAMPGPMLKELGEGVKIGSEIELTFYDGNIEKFVVSGILKGSEDVKQFSVFFSEDYARNGSQLKDSKFAILAKITGAEQMSAEMCKEEMYAISEDIGLERKYVAPSKGFLSSLAPDSQMIMMSAIVGGVILLACILVIYGVFYLSVIGRIHQFGQLRTIGMTKSQMKSFVSREGRLLFLRAVPIGLVIGAAAGYLIIPEGFDIINTLFVLILVFAIIYIITMISVQKPAKIAAAVSPMEALRYVAQGGVERASNKKMCRNMTPVGLGVMNFSKNRKKAVITMCSLGLGGIIFMTAATYISSFDKEGYARQGNFEKAEFVIGYSDSAIELSRYGLSGMQANTPMDTFIKEIQSVDGVKSVEQLKNFGVKFDIPVHDEYGANDQILPLTDEETRKIEKYIEAGNADFEKLMSGDYVLAAGNDIVEEIYGWKFAPGDEITLHFYDGNGMAEKKVTILGILNQQFTLDEKGMEGWFVMPEQAILNSISYDNLGTGILVATESEKEKAVGEVLTQMVDERAELTMETLEERRIVYEASSNQLFGMITGLSVFIMMFSVLSMVNTLITNIVTRKQELAMLESIGMSKSQMKKMLLGESILLVAATVGVTLTIGTMCGYILSTILYNGGAFYMAFRFPAVFTIIYAGVLIFIPLVITLAAMHTFSKEALVVRLRGVEC